MRAPNFCLDGYPQGKCLDDFGGKWLILYFYPRDNTSGCTVEAREFSSLVKEFEELNAVIVGVSPDSVESHEKFAKKHSLKITLLSDPNKDVAKKFGAYGIKMLYGKAREGIIRSTFVISPSGEIIKEFKNVRARGHAHKVLEDLKDIV
ncbi:MAG: peroxiredoxin [Methanobacteriota archaeon]|nr:MAG: peroxiredoxin [Euryarchaeota archaeon]